jgi:hypothetical protein
MNFNKIQKKKKEQFIIVLKYTHKKIQNEDSHSRARLSTMTIT